MGTSVTYLFHLEDDTLLCPVTDFLSLVYDDDAFEAEGLRTPEQILALTVPEYIGIKSIKLKWKQHMLAVPISCHPEH